METELKKELESLKTKEMKPASSAEELLVSKVNKDIEKFQASDVVMNPHKYMQPKLPLPALMKPRPSSRHLYQPSMVKDQCRIHEGRVVSASSSSRVSDSTSSDKATDSRPHTAMLTKLEEAPWYKGYLARPGVFDSITIRGYNHYDNSVFSVYVIDNSGRAVTQTKCESYTPHKKGDYAHSVKCNRVKGTGFKISVINRVKGEVSLLIKDVKVNLCH